MIQLFNLFLFHNECTLYLYPCEKTPERVCLTISLLVQLIKKVWPFK